MEDKWGRVPRGVWIALTAIAPIAWGSTYFVTRHALPADSPIWGGVLRALPAGILLLLIARRLPRGAWWWRSLVLGVLTVGGFFVLIYVAGQRLPSGLAATLMSTSALSMTLFAWAILRRRPRFVALAGGVLGVGGVALMMGASAGDVDAWGVAASLTAMVSSSVGYVLTARWGGDVPAVAMSAWQLLGGSVVLVPAAFIVEGLPPALTPVSVAGFVYVTLVATALAYVVWFAGLRRLDASTVGIVGLLNPVTGVALGVLWGGEAFGVPQAVGLVLVLVGIAVGAVVPRRRAAGRERLAAR